MNIIMTTDEERLAELQENIEGAERVLRETKEELGYLRPEYRSLLQKMYPRGKKFYSYQRGRT